MANKKQEWLFGNNLDLPEFLYFIIKNGGGLSYLVNREKMSSIIKGDDSHYFWSTHKVYYIDFGMKPKFTEITKNNSKKYFF